MTTTFPQPTASTSFAAFRNLLARYLSGEVAESFWNRLMRVLDSGKASYDERIALAAFAEDAAAELGTGAVELPKPKELDTLLTDIRRHAF